MFAGLVLILHWPQLCNGSVGVRQSWMVGTINVHGGAGQPVLEMSVTTQNQLRGMQSGWLSLQQDNSIKVSVNDNP
jgi:hypothetical protein